MGKPYRWGKQYLGLDESHENKLSKKGLDTGSSSSCSNVLQGIKVSIHNSYYNMVTALFH